MHYGGREEPSHPAVTAISCFFALIAGLVLGIGGFFIGTVFPVMVHAALPAMSDVIFLVLWTAALAVPVFGFGRVFRNGKGLGARVYATCGIATIVLLFAGELTGTLSVFPWHARFYVVPGPYDPATPPQHR